MKPNQIKKRAGLPALFFYKILYYNNLLKNILKFFE